MKGRNKGKDDTLDTFYHGRILVLQRKTGYRFSIDAPLLADFIQTQKTDELLELGTGCGIISLLLSIKPFKHITALEIQKELADLAKKNVLANALENRICIVQQDYRSFRSRKKFDIIFSNPPYIKIKQGHLSRSLEKSLAKHEIKSDILSVLKKTSELLKKQGHAYFIFPEKRRDDFFQALKQTGLYLHANRKICPREKSPSNLFLLKCGLYYRESIEFPPLVLYDSDDAYTEEVQEIFAGRISSPYAAIQ